MIIFLIYFEKLDECIRLNLFLHIFLNYKKVIQQQKLYAPCKGYL